MRVGVDGDRVLPILRAQVSYYATTNTHSLNDNENVRNCLNENIYRGGVGDLDWMGGGVSGEMLGRVE
jgi:hypothetical protein